MIVVITSPLFLRILCHYVVLLDGPELTEPMEGDYHCASMIFSHLLGIGIPICPARHYCRQGSGYEPSFGLPDGRLLRTRGGAHPGQAQGGWNESEPAGGDGGHVAVHDELLGAAKERADARDAVPNRPRARHDRGRPGSSRRFAGVRG